MKNVYVALLCLVVTACGYRELSQEELVRYIQDESYGLRKSAVVNGTAIDITYRPTDLWVHQETGGESVSVAAIDSLRKKYDQYYYFILSLSRSDKEALNPGEGLGQYSDLVQTMSFRMAEYVTLTTPTDSIPVGDFMLNRTYGLSSSTDILFVFSREKAADADWVQFNLNEFGLGTGNQRFRFKTKDLERAPKIKFAGK
jgi:hypothetical protein